MAPDFGKNPQLIVLQLPDPGGGGSFRLRDYRLEHKVEQPVPGEILLRNVVFGLRLDFFRELAAFVAEETFHNRVREHRPDLPVIE